MSAAPAGDRGLAGSRGETRFPEASADLAALLRAALGARWKLLHPHIQARFTLGDGETQAEYVGNMHQVRCTRLGGLFARLIRYARVLPHHNADEVPFRFDVQPVRNGLGWIKTRTYHFIDEVFSFRSRMILGEKGELLEHFGGGLGMRVRLEVLPNRLVFVDQGFFLHWRGLRLPLPRPFWPGRFVLVHRDLDAAHFEVTIDVVHPWFGPLFHQDGTFERMEAARG
ncbi:DUF4166 domain-containing protein [Lysobacter sp. 1R34A]|uniref:DUF4166 domain-containing protein n=1 Tax=Lysobacter sp. 1R34A TaxID=3445786 RepID=UPI003EEA5D9A